MTDTAAAQLRRLLHAIPRLADGKDHPIAELTAVAGADLSVLLADLLSLVDRYDAPGGFVDGVQVYVDDRHVCLLSEHFRRPMRLTMSELCALELGMAVARGSRSPDERAAIDGALGKLRQAISALPANDRQDGVRHAELSAPGDAGHLAVLRSAVRARHRVRLRYRAGSAVESAERSVRPYALVFASGAWYVVAHCERSDGLRFFRLDRVEDAVDQGDDFAVPASFSLDALLADGRLFAAAASVRTTVRYSPRVARWVAERAGVALARDGSLTLELDVADEPWLVRHVLQYGTDAEVLDPPVMREAVMRALRELR